MRWNEITVHTTEEAVEMITNFLHELGAGGVSIEESGTLNKQRDTSLGQWYELPLNDIPEGQAVIKAYFAETEPAEEVVVQLRESIRRLRDEIGIDSGSAKVAVCEVNEEDWANGWKKYFKPIRITERLTIKPTWEEYEPHRDELIIELDPGMAFGTGTHPTTALCLRMLEKIVRPGQQIIDVGTGSGVLAIAAAKLGAEHVLALDLDPVAVSSAQENVRLNGLHSRITVRQSDLLGVLRQNGSLKAMKESDETAEKSGGTRKKSSGLGVRLPAQVLVANILAEIIVQFLDDAYDALAAGGLYLVSGIYKNKEAEMEKALLAAGFSLADKAKEQDWVAFVARK